MLTESELMFLDMMDKLLALSVEDIDMKAGYGIKYRLKSGELVHIGLTPPEDHDSQAKFKSYTKELRSTND